MNQEEYERLQEKVATSGQTQQSFIINALAGVVIAPKEEIDVLKNINKNFDNLLRQIRGMATNVNQMAHIANGTGILATIRLNYRLMEGIDDMRFIYASYNSNYNSIDITTFDNILLRIDCNKAEEGVRTTPGSQCALNALAIDEPLEYARLALDGEMQMWVDVEDSLDVW